VTDPTGHQCPECGAPRDTDNTPSCGCTRRAADALREARTAEQAAAEDFDPLRIRPYVELEHDRTAHAAPPPVPPAEATMPLRAIPPTPPDTADLSLFEGADPTGTYGDEDEAPRRPRGRRRTVLLGAGGAVVAVMTAAGLASGLFSYDKPSRDGALPDDVRASVPDDASTSAESAPSPENAQSRRPSAPPSPTRSAGATSSPPASPSTTTSGSPTPPPSATATHPSPTATATHSPATSNGSTTRPPVLRLNSQGPEVTELELRLTQLGLYTRKPHGYYDSWVEDAVSRYQWARGINGDERGVYGTETRERLESETREP
jgi:hypothetical protein